MTFVKGKSGNPGGMTKGTRARILAVSEALEEAFAPKEKNSPDLLVSAIVSGVHSGEVELIKLAAHYRWGRPKTEVDVTVHASLASILAGVDGT